MIKEFFEPEENFSNMIEQALPGQKIENLNLITTGWTNIVYEAETQTGDYFFRFPRDEFWTRTIVKDCEFSKYINGKTSFQTVQLEELSYNKRPFIIHRKIEGVPLAEKIDDMTPEELSQVSKEIAKFMYELHNVKYEKNDVFKTDNIGLNLVDFLNELIEKHIHEENKKFWKYDEFIKKENTCLVHGDLNLSNILIDENNHITGVIDFGFAGFGNKYFDIARVLSRNCPATFKEKVIKNYEQLSNSKLDANILDTEIKLWKEIDSNYIKYMKDVGICK